MGTEQKGHFSIVWSSIKMATATLSSRLLGLVREQSMAYIFGASSLTDAFLVAYRIPNLMRDLFAEGAFSSAFVPTFTEANQSSKRAGRQLLWNTAVVLGAITSLICLATFIWASELIEAFAPSFIEDKKKFETAVFLLQLMSPFLLLVSIAALFMGVLNSLKVFFIPSFAPSTFNMAMIGSIFCLTPWLKSQGIPAVYSLGFGVLIGGFFQILIQLPQLLKKKMGPIVPRQVWDDRTKTIVKKLGPGLLGFAATQINLLVNTILATSTVVGAVSWLNYSFRLFQFPVGVFSVSLSGSNLVHFSSLWKANDKKGAIALLKTSYDLSWLTAVWSASLLMALCNPITHVVFERGKWGENDTAMSAQLLELYLWGLPFYGLYKLLVPVFYAIDRQRVPVITSAIGVGINIVFCVSLIREMSFPVLAMGTSLSIGINAMLLAAILKKDLQLPTTFFFDGRVFKFLIAGVNAFLFTDLFQFSFFDVNDALPVKLLTVALSGLLGTMIFVFILWILGEGKVLKNFKKGKN